MPTLGAGFGSRLSRKTLLRDPRGLSFAALPGEC
jgi:hypothetical protein